MRFHPRAAIHLFQLSRSAKQPICQESAPHVCLRVGCVERPNAVVYDWLLAVPLPSDSFGEPF